MKKKEKYAHIDLYMFMNIKRRISIQYRSHTIFVCSSFYRATMSQSVYGCFLAIGFAISGFSFVSFYSMYNDIIKMIL